MVTTATIGRLVAGLVLLFGNGYFVTIEFAMTRVRQFAESEFQGSRGLERAWEMTERLEIYLSGCQLGITVCSVGLGVVAEPALAAVLDPVIRAAGLAGLAGGGGAGGHTALAAISGLAIINLLHLTVGEQAPTYLGIERTKTIANYGAPILYWWTTILSPVIRLADGIAKALLSLLGVEITRSWAEEEAEDEGDRPQSRGELLSQMGSILSNSGLPEERRREVINAIAIDQIDAGNIMVDRAQIVPLSTTDDPAGNLAVIEQTPLTRYPVVEDDLDEPVGIVYTPQVLQHYDALESGQTTIAEIATDPMTVSPDMPVSDLIDRFQSVNQELALVVEDGRTVGLVTATDAFETIAGELRDPIDDEIGQA
jgi:CBS domain containing-hemolysin-like protein